MSARVSDVLPAEGSHAARPADPGVVPALYSCTDHGLIYRWDGTSWATWATLGPDGVVSIVAGANVTVDDTDPANPIVSAPGGGGSGSGVSAPDGTPTVNTLPAIPNAKDDEFNDGSGMSGPVNGLNAKWSKRNLATPSWIVLDEAKAPGCVMLDLPSGAAADQALYQSAPAGDFRLTVRMSFMVPTVGSRSMYGLFIVDTAGTGVCITMDDPNADVPRLRTMTAWASGSSLAVLGTRGHLWGNGADTYMSLRKSGGTYYAAAWHSERIMPVAVLEVSAAVAFTPAHIGFGRSFQSPTQAAHLYVDWFRVS